MQQSDHPSRFPIAFAESAGASYIRTIPQAHQTATGSDAPASLYDGFPPECFLPVGSGGIPPSGKDFNGILKQLSEQAQWTQAGGPALFNSTFCTAIGGYPLNAILGSASTPGVFFVSMVTNNTADPDADPTNWRIVSSGSLTLSGLNWRRIASDGWIEMGGVASIGRSTEGSFTLSFPWSFPTACLGVTGTTINSAQSNNGQTTIQEVTLSTGSATLYAQNHQSSLNDIAGGMRWRAWGY